MMYKPLPQSVYIGKSAIDGLGLFAKERLASGTVLGITHVQDDRFDNGYIRTPLGGFFNHSKNPNCEAYKKDDLIMLKTIRVVEVDEELTAFYWLYSMENEE